MSCLLCQYWIELGPSDEGYSVSEDRGYCVYCPPLPSGEYRAKLSLWPITLSIDSCVICRCRGCGDWATPIPGDYDYLLLESNDYLLIESGDKLLLE